MSEIKTCFSFEEILLEGNLTENLVLEWIKNQWITPADTDGPKFDEEDVARMRLICCLQKDFGVNEEAVPIILHLLDQIHRLRFHLSCRK